MNWKKGVSVVLVLGLFAAIGFAVWSSWVSDVTTYTILSSDSSPITISVGFTGKTIDCTTTACGDVDVLTLDNNNGNLPMVFNVSTTAVATNGNCTDITNDCTWNFTYGGSGLVNGQQITVVSSLSNLTAELNCLMNSCPAERNATITLQSP